MAGVITSKQVIQRSFYQALLEVALARGYTLDPNNYPNQNKADAEKFLADRQAIENQKGYYVDIYGVGNNQARGGKDLPLIAVDYKGYLPGDVGLNRFHRERAGTDWNVTETPFELLDNILQVTLSAKTNDQLLLLYEIMEGAIPIRGYIKPFIYNKAPFDGNIFCIFTNRYIANNLDHGYLETVYTFEVKDTLNIQPQIVDIETPIKVIDVDITSNEGNDFTNLHIGQINESQLLSINGNVLSINNNLLAINKKVI